MSGGFVQVKRPDVRVCLLCAEIRTGYLVHAGPILSCVP